MLSKRRVLEFTREHTDAADELGSWFDVASKAAWRDLVDVRLNFVDADQVGRVLIFNIRRNMYRLVVKADYRSKLLMVKELLTHNEYDRKAWRNWS